jgi:chromosome segregation ATPase
MAATQPTKSPGAGSTRVPKENPKFATQPGIKATQKDRQASVSSPAMMASPQRHGIVSPMQQAHDTSILVRDLLARMVKVEAKAEKAEGNLTNMKVPMQQVQDASTLTQDLLARMVEVEAKAKEADEKWMNMKEPMQQVQDASTSTQDLLARMVEVEAKVEVAAQKRTDDKLEALRTELVEVRGIAAKRKEEYENLQVATETRAIALEEEVKDLKEALRQEINERKTTDTGVGVLAGKVAENGANQKEEQKRVEQQMDAVEGHKTEMGDMLRKTAEKDVKRSEEVAKLMKQLDDLKGKVEEWKSGKKRVETYPASNVDDIVTMAKGHHYSQWEGAT